MVAPERPHVLMIHGAGGGGWEYDFWKPAWESVGFTVHAPDLEPLGGDYARTRYQHYVAQVRRESMNKSPLVLVGASMGGILALSVAEEIKPEAIILINSVPPAGVGDFERAPKWPEIVRWANGPIQDTIDSLPDGDEKTIQWAHPKWRDESGRVLNEISVGVKVSPPQCPVLVVIGEADDTITPDVSRAIAKWSNADIFSYAQTSHIGPLMGLRRDEIARACAAWARARLEKVKS